MFLFISILSETEVVVCHCCWPVHYAVQRTHDWVIINQHPTASFRRSCRRYPIMQLIDANRDDSIHVHCIVSRNCWLALLVATGSPGGRDWVNQRCTNIWVYTHGWFELMQTYGRLPGTSTSFCVYILQTPKIAPKIVCAKDFCTVWYKLHNVYSSKLTTTARITRQFLHKGVRRPKREKFKRLFSVSSVPMYVCIHCLKKWRGFVIWECYLIFRWEWKWNGNGNGMGMGMKSLKLEGIGTKYLFPHTSTLCSPTFKNNAAYFLRIRLAILCF